MEMQIESKNYTTKCGLYCKDCMRSQKRLYELSGELNELLEALEFEKYAAYRSPGIEQFKKYQEFLSALKAIRELECQEICANGGGKADCKVRECVINKGLVGCWECANFQGCPTLNPLRDVHDCLNHNLMQIKEHGLREWIDKRGKHYPWSK